MIKDLTTSEGRQSFYQSPEWRALRILKLNVNPFCEKCMEEDKLIPATEVHHRIDIQKRIDLCLEFKNLQSLCKKCHSSITFRETHKKVKEKPKIILGFKRKYHL